MIVTDGFSQKENITKYGNVPLNMKKFKVKGTFKAVEGINYEKS